ncbi:hypothetical protein GGS26DRAFT_540482 [Hypomontagnella submonticulosa]|nr:hypothetical protein GGS26DRAFT_540482 [Hypomontagnella submonticulosa]
MHAEALAFEIILRGITRHMSAREEAQDAIMAACRLIPELNAMTFRDAKSKDHEKCNRCQVGIVHGALGKDLVEWRPAQVADVCKACRQCVVRPRPDPRRRHGGSPDGYREVFGKLSWYDLRVEPKVRAYHAGL